MEWTTLLPPFKPHRAILPSPSPTIKPKPDPIKLKKKTQNNLFSINHPTLEDTYIISFLLFALIKITPFSLTQKPNSKLIKPTFRNK
jgi:hypothetical protein